MRGYMKKHISLLLVLAMLFSLGGGTAYAVDTDNQEPDPGVTETHQHDWTGDWDHNDTHHWRACVGTVGTCEAKADSEANSTYAEHSYDTGKCKCGATETVAPPEHEHAFGDGSNKTADYGSNATQHWLKCKDPDCDGSEDKNGNAATKTAEDHVWDGTTGQCTTCDYECQHGGDKEYETLDGDNAGNHKVICVNCKATVTETEKCTYDQTGDKCICGATKPADPPQHNADSKHVFADFDKPADNTVTELICNQAGCGKKIALTAYYDLCAEANATEHEKAASGKPCEKCGYEPKATPPEPGNGLTAGGTATVDNTTVVNGTGVATVTTESGVIKVVVTLTAEDGETLGGQPQEGKPDGTPNYHLTIPITGLTTADWELVKGGEQGGQYGYDDVNNKDWNVDNGELKLWLPVAENTCKVVLKSGTDSAPKYQVVEVATKHAATTQPEHTATGKHVFADYTKPADDVTAGTKVKCKHMLEGNTPCTNEITLDAYYALCAEENATEHEKATADTACTKCGYKAPAAPPTHEADTSKWGSNADGHWNPCKVAGCTESHKYNEAAHTWDAKTGKCTVCEYACEHDWADKDGVCNICGMDCPNKANHDKIVAGETCKTCGFEGTHEHTFDATTLECACGVKHTHAFSTGAEYGKDDNQHWRVCTDAKCPVKETVKNDITAHEYDAEGNCVCGAKKPHEHIWSTGNAAESYGHDDNQHWRICTDENCPDEGAAKNAVAAHTFVDDKTDLDNVKSVCSVCGMEKPAGYQKPTHVWATAWSKDDTHHWHVCEEVKDPACTEKNDYAEHVYDQADDKCVCGAVKPHEHTWSDWKTSETEHWKTCTGTDCTEENARGTHSYSDWEEKTAASYETAGEETRTCSVCHYEQTREIPKLVCPGHEDANADGKCDICGAKMPAGPDDPNPPAHNHDNWDIEWSKDATNHWHKCLTAGCDETTDPVAHTYGDWTIDKAATSSTAGSKSRTCTVCTYKQTEAIPATGGGSSGGGSSSGGGGGGGSSSSSSTTTKNPDGSTTTTKTDNKTGTVTETTKKPDGSTVVTTTKKDGSSTQVTTAKNGVVATVATTTTGQVTATVELPTAVVSAAGKAPVNLPIEKVKVATNLAAAPSITVSSGKTGTVKVAIPTSTVTPGTVAVLVRADGTTEVLKTSVATEAGVIASLPSGSTVKVIDNSKSFADVSTGAWANNAVSFVSARGLFVGTSESTFSPSTPMNCAMITTVLGRLGGANLDGGTTWYEKGMQWAASNGINTIVTDPGAHVNREQVITMIWRYMGSPAAAGSLTNYGDANAVSDYAAEAMRWAVENGIISGYNDGTLAPQAETNRAEVAQILQNLITNLETAK